MTDIDLKTQSLNNLLTNSSDVLVPTKLHPIVLIVHIMKDGSGDYSWIKVYLELLYKIGYTKDNIYLFVYMRIHIIRREKVKYNKKYTF